MSTTPAEKLKKTLGKRIQSLCVGDPDIASFEIKEDTLRKYYNGSRFPNTENLVAIKERYNVPYAYLFGDTDNKDKNAVDLGCKLGLSSKSLKKLLKINKSNDKERNLQLFILNQLIEKIDLLDLAKLLLIPNENNPHIKSEDIYEYFAFFVNKDYRLRDYDSALQEINEKKEHDDYLINKRLFNLFENIRNSKECAEIFINYVDSEMKAFADLEKSLRDFDPSEFQDDNTTPTKEDYEFIKNLFKKEQDEIENQKQKMIKERKDILGI